MQSLAFGKMWVAVVAVLVTVSSGCGGGGGDDEPSDDGGTPDAEAPDGAPSADAEIDGGAPTAEERLEEHALGSVTVVRGEDGQVVGIVGQIVPPDSVASEAEAVAQFFFEQWGDLFGIDDPATQVMLVDRTVEPAGPTGESFDASLAYQRQAQGLPVVQAELSIHIELGRIVSVMGNLPRDVDVPSEPTVTAEDAEATVAEAAPSADVGGAELAILNEAIFEGRLGPSRLVWQVPIAEGIATRTHFVDATDGTLLELALDEWAAARDRRVYHAATCPEGTDGADCKRYIHDNSTQTYDETGMVGTDASGEGQTAWEALGVVHDYFMTSFGRDSYDGEGAPLYAYTEVLSLPGSTPAAAARNPDDRSELRMYLAPGYADQDVIAHEFGHMFLAAERVLPLPGTQTAEIHEGFADIVATWMDATYPWVIGDELADGPLRNVMEPAVAHMDDYDEDTWDPHVNSSILSYAFHLMVTGGPSSTDSVPMEHAAEIFFNAGKDYITPATTFELTYVSLWMSAFELASSVESPVTYGDCGRLNNAMAEVGVGDPDSDEDCFPDRFDTCPDIYNPAQLSLDRCLLPFRSCRYTDSYCVNYIDPADPVREACMMGESTWRAEPCSDTDADGVCLSYLRSPENLQAEVYYGIGDDRERRIALVAQCVLRGEEEGGPGIWVNGYRLP